MATVLPSLGASKHLRATPYTPSFLQMRPRRGSSFSPSAELDKGESSSVATQEPASSPSSDAPPSPFNIPEPRRFHVRSDKLLDIIGCSLALPMRLGSGALAQGYKASWVPEPEFPSDAYASFSIAGRKLLETSTLGPRPTKPIEIYEFEGCPFCRKVREIVSILDLDVLYYPCPKDGPNFRPKAIQLGGKKQFPYMVDPNTGVSMYESDDIIKYLVEKYGNGKVPLLLSLGLLTTLTAGFAMIARMGKGSQYVPSKLPERPLELWAYEASPFCKIVREVMVELELPHIYHSTPRGSSKRFELFKRAGHFQVTSDHFYHHSSFCLLLIPICLGAIGVAHSCFLKSSFVRIRFTYIFSILLDCENLIRYVILGKLVANPEIFYQGLIMVQLGESTHVPKPSSNLACTLYMVCRACIRLADAEQLCSILLNVLRFKTVFLL